MADISGGVNMIPQSVSTPTKDTIHSGDNSATDHKDVRTRFNGNWTLGSWFTDENNPNRATSLGVCWNWILRDGPRGRPRQRICGHIVGTNVSSDITPDLYRDAFYPKHDSFWNAVYETSPPTGHILAIELQVFGLNPYSPTEAHGVPYQTAMYEYERPLPPEMSIDYDEDTKELTFKLTSSIDLLDSSSNQDRYETEILKFQRITSIDGKRTVENYIKSKLNDGAELVEKEYEFTTREGIFPNGSNATIRSKLSRETDYILYLIDSRNVGIRGEGQPSVEFYRQKGVANDSLFVMGIPPKATIASITKVGEYVQVRLKNPVRNSVPSEIREYDTPAIKVELEKATSTLEEYRQNAANLSWSVVSNASGSADSVIFQEPIAEAQKLTRGEYTYYRIKTSRGDMPSNYSEPMRSELFHKEPLSAVGSKIQIVGWKLSSDGNSVALDLSWGTDDADQIEITYSRDPNAWTDYDPSDENQQSVLVTVVDTETEDHAYKDHRGTFTITGLRTEVDSQTDIRPWYFRVRRKREDNNSYGYYNNYADGTLTQIIPVSYIDDVDIRIVGMTRDQKKDVVTVTAAWTESDPINLEGTQFQWSTTDDLSSNTTSVPSTYDVDDNDATRENNTVDLRIHDIDGGNTLHVRARRYLYDNIDETKTYGLNYSEEATLAITAEDDIVAILDVSENGDGESLKLRLGWDEDDSDGTEISWSTKAYAWESSSSPSTFNVNWDGVLSEDTEYKYETTASIDGLEVGKTYYIRARRYQEGNETTYGSYTEMIQAIPYSKPEDVVANASEYHPKGKDLEVSWTFTSESEQTAYVIQNCVDDGTDTNSFVKAEVIDSQNSDVNGVAISADKVNQYAVDGVLRLIVTVATGGGSSDSDMLTINVVDAPTCEVEMSDEDSIVDSIRNVKFKIASPNESNRFVIQLAAHGASLSIPDRDIFQSFGEILWVGEVHGSELQWEDGVAEYTIPETLAESETYLIEGSKYELRVTAHDDFTGLSMEDPAVTPFTVQFEEMPKLYDDETSFILDEDRCSALIVPKLVEAAPEGTEIHIYRHGLKNDSEIARGKIDAFEVTDSYVPFGIDADLYYPIMIKTPDGNVQCYRLIYKFKKDLIRIDWGEGNSVELPFNLSPSNTYTKNFEKRSYLNGNENGYYGPGVAHTGQATSAIFNVRHESDLPEQEAERQREILAKLRDLRTYNDSVFVRMSDGSAFEANVEVKKIDPKYDSLLYDISIAFTEIDTTSKFNVTMINTNISEEEEQEPPEGEQEIE